MSRQRDLLRTGGANAQPDYELDLGTHRNTVNRRRCEFIIKTTHLSLRLAKYLDPSHKESSEQVLEAI